MIFETAAMQEGGVVTQEPCFVPLLFKTRREEAICL
jgi:hypothetical protein